MAIRKPEINPDEYRPFIDYDPETVSIASIRDSLAFLAAEAALKAARSTTKPKAVAVQPETPLLPASPATRRSRRS